LTNITALLKKYHSIISNYSGFTYQLNNNTNTTMMNNAVTQIIKNRAEPNSAVSAFEASSATL